LRNNFQKLLKIFSFIFIYKNMYKANNEQLINYLKSNTFGAELFSEFCLGLPLTRVKQNCIFAIEQKKRYDC